jgi:hypothetical protein
MRPNFAKVLRVDDGDIYGTKTFHWLRSETQKVNDLRVNYRTKGRKAQKFL